MTAALLDRLTHHGGTLKMGNIHIRSNSEKSSQSQLIPFKGRKQADH